jgi:tetratricopeptide (TPR) repeat protein
MTGQSLFANYCWVVSIVGQSLIAWEIGRHGIVRYFLESPRNRRTRFAILLLLSAIIVGLIGKFEFPNASPKQAVILLAWLLALGFVRHQLLPLAWRLYERARLLHELAGSRYGDYHKRGVSASFEEIRSDIRLKEAESLYQRAAELVRKSANPELNLLMVDIQLGLLYRQQGKFETAKEHLTESLRMIRQLEFLQPERRDFLLTLSMVLFRRGELHHIEGEIDEAQKMYQQSLAIDEKLRDINGIAINQRMLSELDADRSKSHGGGAPKQYPLIS